MSYIAKTAWQAHIDSILASQLQLPASVIRSFETDLLDSFAHLDDLVGIGGGISIPFYRNMAFVNSDNGDDSTAVLGRIDLPYKTLDAAIVDVNGLAPYGILHITGGVYNYSTTIANCIVYANPQVTLNFTANANMFENCDVFGYGEYYHLGTGDLYTDIGETSNWGKIFEFVRAYATGGNAVKFSDGTYSFAFRKAHTIRGKWLNSSAGNCIWINNGRQVNVDVEVAESTGGSILFVDSLTEVHVRYKGLVARTSAYDLVQVNNPTGTTHIIYDVENSISPSTSYGINIGGQSFVTIEHIIRNAVVLVNHAAAVVYLKSTFIRKVNLIAGFVYCRFIQQLVQSGGQVFEGLVAEIDMSGGTANVVAGSSYVQNSGGNLTLRFLNGMDSGDSMVISGGDTVIEGDFVDFGSNPTMPLIELQAGDLTIKGQIQCKSTDSAAHTIEKTTAGTATLTILPGTRIKCETGQAPIAVSAGTLNIRSLGLSWINHAISGSPTFIVGTSGDIALDANI